MCKAWRKALATPSLAWQHCHIRSCELAACLGDTDDSHIRMQKNRILRWAVCRGAAVRCLQVGAGSADPARLPPALQMHSGSAALSTCCCPPGGSCQVQALCNPCGVQSC